jgi:hypothetical protein
MVRSLESARRLYATQIQCYPEKSASPDKTSLFSIDTQICGEPRGLALRIQEILSVPSHKGHLLYCNPSAPRKTLGEPPLTMLICMHVPQKELARLINPVVRAYRARKHASLSTYTCGRCKTDFCIEVCEYGTRSALIITKWFNLGADLSPNDPHWKRHAQLSERVHTGKVRPRTCHEKTSARVYFENASP